MTLGQKLYYAVSVVILQASLAVILFYCENSYGIKP